MNKFREFLNNNKYVNNLANFFLSDYYLILVGFLTLIAYYFAVELIIACVLIVLCGISMIVCKDIRTFFVTLVGFIFIVPAKHYTVDIESFNATYFGDKNVYIIVLGVLLTFFVMFRTIVHKTFLDLFTKKRQLTFYLILFCIAILFNGLLSQNYTYKNFIFALVIILTWFVTYIVIVNNLKFDQNLARYFCKCCFYLTIVLILQLPFNYIKTGESLEYLLNNKNDIFFGWGIGNNYGTILAIFIPANMYLACNEEKGYLYYVFAILSYVFICLVFCVTAMLFGAIMLVISIVLLIKYGKNRKINLIITGILFVLVVVAIILLFDKFVEFTQSKSSFDNGRLRIWKEGLIYFAKYPLFGQGFYDCIHWTRSGFLPPFYHNTIIELMATTGLVGIVTYLIFRIKTIVMCVKKLTLENLFLSLCVLTLLLTSLLDNHIFNVYPVFIQSICLAIIELSNFEDSQELEELLKIKKK